MKEEFNPKQMADRIFNLFLKETEGNKMFRDALRNFITAIETKENEWIEKNLKC